MIQKIKKKRKKYFLPKPGLELGTTRASTGGRLRPLDHRGTYETREYFSLLNYPKIRLILRGLQGQERS